MILQDDKEKLQLLSKPKQIYGELAEEMRNPNKKHEANLIYNKLI